jgi:hypothetical protein
METLIGVCSCVNCTAGEGTVSESTKRRADAGVAISNG